MHRSVCCILYQLPPLLLAIFGFYGAGKDDRGRHTDSPFGRHPICPIDAPNSLAIFFTSNALSAATLPIYPGLGQAQNNAGLHNHAWLHSQLLD